MVEIETVQDSREVARIASGRPWEGYVTLANLDAVADRIKALIGDKQRYTSVYCNEGFDGYFPQVRTSMVAEISVNRRVYDGKPNGYITVSDGYVSWLSTDAADQDEARARNERNRPTRVRLKRDQIEITDRAPVGFIYYWVIAPEQAGGDPA